MKSLKMAKIWLKMAIDDLSLIDDRAIVIAKDKTEEALDFVKKYEKTVKEI